MKPLLPYLTSYSCKGKKDTSLYICADQRCSNVRMEHGNVRMDGHSEVQPRPSFAERYTSGGKKCAPLHHFKNNYADTLECVPVLRAP